MDSYPESRLPADARPVIVMQGDVLNPPPLGEFDIVGVFDALEHLSEDSSILRGLDHMLKPGGALLITVPAHMSLWIDRKTAAKKAADELKITPGINGLLKFVPSQEAHAARGPERATTDDA